MQIHGPSEVIRQIKVHYNPGSRDYPKSFAVISLTPNTDLTVHSEGEADQLIAAAQEAKRLLASGGEDSGAGS